MRLSDPCNDRKCGNVIDRTDPCYNEDRQISNARFNYFPYEIHYCTDASSVSLAIQLARARKLPVRIRSGGHQHEGMCSGNGVQIIDVSCINKFEFVGARVWIGAGASLNSIYSELWRYGYTFAGGGCLDVHIGGLAQGGGWGPVSRRFGLTCDSLVGVEMVTADRGVIRPMEDNPADRPLLDALRGGGGGNFGVVTKYCFQLHRWREAYTDITVGWTDAELAGDRLAGFVDHWMCEFPGDLDLHLTTFLRVSVLDTPDGERAVIGGRYLGTESQARAVMGRLLAGQPGASSVSYKETRPQREMFTEAGEPLDPEEWERVRRTMGRLEGYQPGPELPAAESVAAAPAAEPNLGETCAGIPLRHKISSGFASEPFDRTDGVRTLTDYIRSSVAVLGARQYVSLHCLGGAIAKPQLGSSFAFRDRRVLFQYQAWWQPDAPGLDAGLIQWIERFRETMSRYTDGAFINFVDRDIPLREYYKGKLPSLIQQKRIWDDKDFFRFEMGIPVALE